LEQEIIRVRHSDASLVFVMIGLDDFINIRSKIDEFTNIENFILRIFKYLQNSLKKTDTVIYFEAEMFYIMMPYTKVENAIKSLKVVGHRRTIGQNHITLSSGVTSLRKSDTVESMMERCLVAYNEAILDHTCSNVVEI